MTDNATTRHDRATAMATAWAAPSPLTSDRIRNLVKRALIGAPSLTHGEVRELAEAVQVYLGRDDG